MSQNPYQSIPMLPNSKSVVPQEKPGGLTAIAVICLILGTLGVLVSLATIVMLFFQDDLNQFQNAQPGGSTPEFVAEMEALQTSQLLPNLIFSGCNVIIGSLLVTGSIGVLGTNEWGRSLLRNSLLVAILFVIVRGIYGMWIQFQSISTISKMIPSGGEGAAELEMIMRISIIVGLVIGIVWLVVLVVFYAWSRSYLNKPPIRSLFGAAN